jgi:hypothetical protein
MRKSIRCALVAGVVVGALAATGSALAAFSPKTYVKTAPTGINIRVAVNATDDPTARFALYVPVAYTGNFSAAPGTVLGPVSAHAQAADLGGAILPLTGNVLVANPVDPTIVAASAACDPVPHAAIWVLSLTAAGQTLNVPLFVDQAAGAEAALASFKLVVCLPPPDVPPGTPGRATFGAKLLDADFTVNALSAPTAAGTFVWRALWTPYNPGVGTVNAAGTVQTQALWFQPTTLSVASKVTTKRKKVKGKIRVTNTVTVFGTLAAAGQGAPAQQIDIFAGTSASTLKKVKSVTTNGAGAYIVTAPLTKPTYYQARATSPDRELGPSLCAPGLPAPCISATVSGGSLTSGTVRAVPKKK